MPTTTSRQGKAMYHRSVLPEYVDVGVHGRPILKRGRRQHPLVPLALEVIKPRPMLREVLRAEDEAVDALTGIGG